MIVKLVVVPIEGSVDSFLQYVSCYGPLPDDFACNWHVFLSSQKFSLHQISCSVCEENTSIENYAVSPAVVLFIEFSVQFIDNLQIHQEILVSNITYQLTGMVRNKSFHFTVDMKVNGWWMYVDDLKRSSHFFTSFPELLLWYPDGWCFFATL